VLFFKVGLKMKKVLILFICFMFFSCQTVLMDSYIFNFVDFNINAKILDMGYSKNEVKWRVQFFYPNTTEPTYLNVSLRNNTDMIKYVLENKHYEIIIRVIFNLAANDVVYCPKLVTSYKKVNLKMIPLTEFENKYYKQNITCLF
jgi:hypothetical protein